jgi:outer membrane protein OmpA-like peptidoglycan-associated protein
MKILRVAAAVLALGLLWHGRAGAEGVPFVGIDLGVAEPTNGNFRGHVETGGTGNPYAGYMFNKYLGVQGQLHFTFLPPDNDHRGFAGENDTTGIFGGTIGPRLTIPLGDLVELYGTGQGGGFTGMHGRVNHTAAGFSVGGGLDFNVTRNVAIGAFGRWNRAYMSPRPDDLGEEQKGTQRYGEDIRWATAGIGLRYTFAAPEAPPPPPPPAPMAKPAPPPPPPPMKKHLVLRSVNFDFNKATLRKDAMPVLNEAVQILKEEGNVDVTVQGHTDSVGSDAYNMKLSRQRADAVRDYFIQHGIAAKRITAEGLGESHPVASNKTADGRAQNRRVELHVK